MIPRAFTFSAILLIAPLAGCADGACVFEYETHPRWVASWKTDVSTSALERVFSANGWNVGGAPSEAASQAEFAYSSGYAPFAWREVNETTTMVALRTAEPSTVTGVLVFTTNVTVRDDAGAKLLLGSPLGDLPQSLRAELGAPWFEGYQGGVRHCGAV